MEPTQEQLQAIEAFRTGKSLAIEAGAGTGKTSTLVLLAQDAGRRRGQYVAFNKALVTDSAGKFPLSVSCNTAHSLAFRAVGHKYQRQLNAPRIPGWRLAQQLGIGSLHTTDFAGQPKVLAPGFLANHVMRAITSFCQSADTELHAFHFPYLDGLDAPDEHGRRTYQNNDQISEFLLPTAQRIWSDLQTPGANVPFKHEHYLKMYQLGNPRIDADYVLFDEAQDANPVIAAIVAAQTHAQLVYVGDSQQEIYAWTGAVNALSHVDVANRTYLTQSFRFGQAIADQANLVLEGLHAPLRLTGNPAIESSVEPVDEPKAILTRTNAAGIGRLLELQRAGKHAHFLGGSTDVLSFARAADELMLKGSTNYAELSCFDSWEAVRAYVGDQNEDGADLRLQVKLVDTYGTEAIIRALSMMPPEDRAEVVISTAHKSKGRQWGSVQLDADFRSNPTTVDDGKDHSPEQRLLYVALTRAQYILDRTALDGEGDL